MNFNVLINNIRNIIFSSRGNLYVKNYSKNLLYDMNSNFMGYFRSYKPIVKSIFPNIEQVGNSELKKIYKEYDELTNMGKYYFDNSIITPGLIKFLVESNIYIM